MDTSTMGYRPILSVICVVIALFASGSIPCVSKASLAPGTTFVVTKAADTNDGMCDADCSLREAIIAANSNPGLDTIVISTGIYTLTIAGTGENAAAQGDLDITDSLTLTGAGEADTVIDGGALDRVFQVFSNVIVTFSGVTIRNGYLGTADGAGGIRSSGIVTITACTIASNKASYGGGIVNFGAMTLISTTVSNNRALNGGGGGIYTGSNTATVLRGSTIYSNTSSGAGGGIVIGVYNGAALTMTNTTVSQNIADYGGGVAIFGQTTNINNSTIVNNSDLSDAGGLDRIDGVVLIQNAIVAQNRSNTGAPDCNGPISSQGYNLIGSTAGCIITPTTGDRTNMLPMIGPLQDNGGSTLTHALLPGSPAVDAGNPSAPGTGGNACEPIDQRGVARPQNGRCDMGAYEAILLHVFLPTITKQ